tara:strand:+ start:2520 stop:2822 length:303 start_codon:yes stop_codon:yes gene_type:complete
MAKYEKLLDEAIQNIRLDRQATNTALDEVCQDIHSGKLDHGRSGLVVAKYLETLQRSNEQLVKVASLLTKTSHKNENISGAEIDAIYDNLNEHKEDVDGD